MPGGKQQHDAARAKSKKPNSFLSSLKRILFSCTGKKSVRVLPQQISVRPPTAWDIGTRPSRDRHSAHTPAALFYSSSRPTTAANEVNMLDFCSQLVKFFTISLVYNRYMVGLCCTPLFIVYWLLCVQRRYGIRMRDY